MPEILKLLSDRATPGEASADMIGYKLIAHPPGSTFVPEQTLVALCACGDKAGPNVHFLAELWTRYRRGELHDDTALATAVARARREALEEAAKIFDEQEMQYEYELITGLGSDGQRVGRKSMWARADLSDARKNAAAIRALAATPPEARQTETGWKPIKTAPCNEVVWLFEPHTMGGFMFAGIRRDEYDIWTNNLDHAAQHPTHWQPLPAPPLPAIGNLEGEGRS